MLAEIALSPVTAVFTMIYVIGLAVAYLRAMRRAERAETVVRMLEGQLLRLGYFVDIEHDRYGTGVRLTPRKARADDDA